MQGVLLSLLEILLFTVLHGSVLILLFCLLRRILGLRLGARMRMGIWWMLFAVHVLMLVFTNSRNLRWHSLVRSISPGLRMPYLSVDIQRMAFWRDADVIQYTGTVFLDLAWVDRSGRTELWYGEITAFVAAVPLIWFAGAVVFLLWHLAGDWRLRRRLCALPDCTDPEIMELVRRERAYQGISDPVPVKLVPDGCLRWPLPSPCVVGLWPPMLVFPERAWRALSLQEREAVVTHEVFHIRKGDNLHNLLLVVLGSVLWFHPVLWLGIRTMRRDLEYLRDLQILELPLSVQEARNYALAILSVAAACCGRCRSALHSGVLSASGLGFRIHLMVQRQKNSRILSAAALMIMLAAVLFCIIWGRNSPNITQITVT